MAGERLVQLLQAVLDQETAINTALAAAGLAPIRRLTTGPVEPTARRPLAVVSLAGARTVERPMQGGPYVQRLAVTVTVAVDGGEDDALAYEGVIQTVLASAKPALVAAVTDGALAAWLPTGGDLAEDTERRNAPRGAWRVVVQFAATLTW